MKRQGGGDPLPAEVVRHVRESILANRAAYVAEHAHCDRTPCEDCMERAAAGERARQEIRACMNLMSDWNRTMVALTAARTWDHQMDTMRRFLNQTATSSRTQARAVCARRRHHARGSLRSGRTSARRSRRTTSPSRSSSPAGLADEGPHEPPGEAGRQLTRAPASPARGWSR